MIGRVEDEFLPRDWTTVLLKTVVTKLVDGSHNPPSKRESGVPMLSARNILNNQIVFEEYRLISKGDFEKEHRRTRISPGDVLLTIVGTIGRSAVVPASAKGFALQRSVAVITPTGVLPKYLMYQFQGPFLQRHFEKHARGTAQKGVYLKTLGQAPILVAPLGQQERIVAEIEKQFSRLDEAVANLKRVKANLKRYKAAVLKAAVEGKLTEDWRKQHPNVEPAYKLLERILAERRAKWTGRGNYKQPVAPDVTEIPSLPEGWAWATFEQISSRVTVGHVGPMKHEYISRGVPFLRSQNIRENKFDPEGLLYIPREFHAKLSKSVIHPGDLAVVRSGSVGVTCVIPETLAEANCADLVLIQQPHGLVPQFGAYYMNSLAKRRVEAGKVGVALTHFNTKSVAAMPVPVPPLIEQQLIVAEVERRLSVIDELESTVEANLTRADRLRQSVLARAFSGELTTLQ